MHVHLLNTSKIEMSVSGALEVGTSYHLHGLCQGQLERNVTLRNKQKHYHEFVALFVLS